MNAIAQMANNGKRWLVGVAGAFISGGATSISAGFASTIIDPKDFNLAQGLGHTLKLVACTFVVAGMVSLSKYLALHPVPDSWDGSERREIPRGGTTPDAHA